jgi:hypothetical protein
MIWHVSRKVGLVTDVVSQWIDGLNRHAGAR